MTVLATCPGRKQFYLAQYHSQTHPTDPRCARPGGPKCRLLLYSRTGYLTLLLRSGPVPVYAVVASHVVRYQSTAVNW